MAEEVRLCVMTPSRTFYDGQVTMVELSTTDGDIGVYPHHIPMTSIVSPGILKIHERDGVREAALMSGFMVIEEDRINILAEVCEWPSEIDFYRAKEAEKRARERIQAKTSSVNISRAEQALKRALVRLEFDGTSR